MRKLSVMLIKNVLTVFIFAIFFFVTILQIGDLFTNLPRFLNQNIDISQVFLVSLYYLPKTLNYAMPLSLLFSVSFTLGTLYSHNELIAILGNGISLRRFVRPLFFIGILFSLFYFIFEETTVIPTFKQKNELTRQLLNQTTTLSNTNSTVMVNEGRIIYNFMYYNFETKSINSLIIIELDKNNSLIRRLDAEWTEWSETYWTLRKCREYIWNSEKSEFTEKYHENFVDQKFHENPDTFMRKTVKADELNLLEAYDFVQSLKRSGLPYLDAETDYFNRLSFGFTPFMVIFIASALGGKFKKNVLLMSLFTSLAITMIFFVIQMVSSLFSRLGYFPPFIGSFLGVVIGYSIGFILYKFART